jgi:hypothetical protein
LRRSPRRAEGCTFRRWSDAIGLLLSAVRDEPRVVVIDEFPFLVKSSPSAGSPGNGAYQRWVSDQCVVGSNDSWHE